MDDKDFKEMIEESFIPAFAQHLFPNQNVVIDIKRDKPNTEPKKYLYIPPKNTD